MVILGAIPELKFQCAMARYPQAPFPTWLMNIRKSLMIFLILTPIWEGGSASPPKSAAVAANESFIGGCIMYPQMREVYKACQGCDLYRFQPNGDFEGIIGCDQTILGKWSWRERQIIVTGQTTVACNHYLGNLEQVDEAEAQKRCKKFEARNTAKALIHFRPDGNQWQMRVNEKPWRDVGKLYPR